MSSWTYIRGMITVETAEGFQSKQMLKEYLEDILREISHRMGYHPRRDGRIGCITGSEGPADIFVNPYHGPRGYGYSGEDYTLAFITIDGSLRDRYGPETDKEFILFIKKLRQYVKIENLLVRLEGMSFSKIYTDKSIDSEVVIEKIDSDDAPYLPDEESEEAKKNEEIRDKFWRIRVLNFERYVNKKFENEDMINKYRWALEHMTIPVFEKVVADDYKLGDFSLSARCIGFRQEHKLPIPQEYLDAMTEDESQST